MKWNNDYEWSHEFMRDSERFDETDRGISMVIHNDAIWDDQSVSESMNEFLKRNQNDPRMNATIAIDDTMRLMTMIYGQSRDLQLTNKSSPHIGDDCAYFSIQRRCFDVLGTVSLKISRRIYRLWILSHLRVLGIIKLKITKITLRFSAKSFTKRSHCWNPFDRLSVLWKKRNEVGFVVIRNFILSPEQLISSISMTVLIALNYIISFLFV